MERKYIDGKALDIDTSNRKVKVAISMMGNEDRDGDIIDFGAYDKTIKAKGPNGSKEIWHLTDHGWRIADSALSKYEELYVKDNLLIGVAGYRDSFLWRDVAWPLYEAGDINQHSVGFRTVRKEVAETDGPTIIKEIELWEGSAVLWGANPNTDIQELVKSHFQNKQESFEDRVKWLCKSIKDGKYKEEESLMILELKHLEDIFETFRKGNPTQETDLDSQQKLLDMTFILSKHFS